jgi:hypothetical protein
LPYWRLVGKNGATFMLTPEQLFDLADLLDEVCDELADRDP